MVAFDLLQQGADGLEEQLLLTDDHQLVDALPMGRKKGLQLERPKFLWSISII